MKHFLSLTDLTKVGMELRRNPTIVRSAAITRIIKMDETTEPYSWGVNTAIWVMGANGWFHVTESYDAVLEQMAQQVAEDDPGDEWKP